VVVLAVVLVVVVVVMSATWWGGTAEAIPGEPPTTTRSRSSRTLGTGPSQSGGACSLTRLWQGGARVRGALWHACGEGEARVMGCVHSIMHACGEVRRG
jgi:hypothetical protein